MMRFGHRALLCLLVLGHAPPLPGAGHAAPATLYTPDPADPWNRLYPLLFPGPGPGAGAEDTSTLLQSGDLRPLLRPEARREILRLLSLGQKTPPAGAAAVLLQSDLWQRCDALGALLVEDKTAAGQATIRELRGELARAVRAVALPAEALRAVRPNLAQLVAAHPDLLSGLDTMQGWVEVVTRARERPAQFGGEAKDGTRHAQVDGHRSVFRRFLWVPPSAGGADWLRRTLRDQPATVELPTGTRAVLVQTPLALSPEGRLVAVPLVTLIEARVVAPESAALQERLDTPFHVLEGRRALLSRSAPAGGGLVRLSPDHPLPMLGSCLPGPMARQPLRGICRNCHGPRGQHLSGTMSHGEHRFREADDPGLMARRSIEEKTASKDYQELLRLLAPR